MIILIFSVLMLLTFVQGVMTDEQIKMEKELESDTW